MTLALRPGAIPGLVGITLEPQQLLLPWLLAAAEAATVALCLLALWAGTGAAVTQAVLVLAVLHAGSALAGLAGVAAGASPLVLVNVLVRVALVLLLLLAWRRG